MPSPTIRIAAALIGLLSTSSVLAEDLPGFTFAEACRTDEASAVVRLVYQGGNCETTAELEPKVELDGATAGVTIATKSTAEICTMQIVPNHVEKAIGVAPGTTTMDITLLNTDGQPQARQTIPVLTDGVDCSAAGESF